MSPHSSPERVLFGEDQRPDPGDDGNRAYQSSRNRKRALKKSRRRPANGDALKKFQNSFGALLRMAQHMGCIVSSLHCKRQQMRFTRHKSTQNLVGFPVYFQNFLIFVQRSNYHWSCFRAKKKKLHHKFKNKYIMPQNVIECWLKCKNRYWNWCMQKCSFFRTNECIFFAYYIS